MELLWPQRPERQPCGYAGGHGKERTRVTNGNKFRDFTSWQSIFFAVEINTYFYRDRQAWFPTVAIAFSF
jgi:hypothetical protein